MIATGGLPVRVFTLDTGLLFPETYALRKTFEESFGLQIRAVAPAQSVEEQAAEYGENLWERDPDRCCELRKVVPLRKELASHFAWITAIRREQSADRAAAGTVEFDEKFGLVKVNPLLDWTSRDVDAYIKAHGIPTNPLHEKGCASVGCWPCTTPVRPGEDPRAGRWRGTGKTECGLHKRPSLIETERKESNV
jgi:phosphoadenylyl-sulfate reductase (thioredoxin)